MIAQWEIELHVVIRTTSVVNRYSDSIPVPRVEANHYASLQYHFTPTLTRFIRIFTKFVKKDIMYQKNQQPVSKQKASFSGETSTIKQMIHKL